MKKIFGIILFFIILISIVTFYDYNSKKIKTLENEIADIEKNLNEVSHKIELYKITDDLRRTYNSIAENFVKYHTTGDVVELKKIIADTIEIESNDGKIYGKIIKNGRVIDLLLFDSKSKEKYSYMKIQGYGYLDDSESIIIHIREFYFYENGDDVTPPTFLNLFLNEIDGEWKVVDFEFDV